MDIKLILFFRCREALEACKGFDSCSPHDVQAAKLADVWPVKNVWGILQQRVKKREPESKEQLRRNILEEWQYIDDDKAMCRKLIESISKRLQVKFYVIYFSCDWSVVSFLDSILDLCIFIFRLFWMLMAVRPGRKITTTMLLPKFANKFEVFGTRNSDQ